MKDTSWYRAGTISVTNGSNTVTGSSVGSWAKNISPGDILLLGQLPYQILSVADGAVGAGTLTIVPNYSGANLSGAGYAIIRSYTNTAPADLAARVAEMLQTYHVTMDQMLTWMTGGGDGTLDTLTLTDFAGVSGISVPTLPFLAPLQTRTSVTAAPNKIPLADSNGKLDPNWLPAELVNAILSAGSGSSGSGSGTTTTITAEKLLQIVQSTQNQLITLNTKTARFYDVFITDADYTELRLNYVNSAPSSNDVVHTGVPNTANLQMVIRVINTTGTPANITWAGMPVVWENDDGYSVPGTVPAQSVQTYTLRWLGSAGLVGVSLPMAFNNWIGYSQSGSYQPAA